VDSAEKWKQFAEQLQAKQGELQEALAGAQAELQVGAGACGEEMSCRKRAGHAAGKRALLPTISRRIHAQLSRRHPSAALTPSLGSLPASLLLQTVQQSLEVAQEACNDLDLRATQVGCCWPSMLSMLTLCRRTSESQPPPTQLLSHAECISILLLTPPARAGGGRALAAG